MLEKNCSNCNYQYTEDERFCPNCGQARGEENNAYNNNVNYYGAPNINQDLSGTQINSAEDVERMNVPKSAKSKTTAGVLALLLGAWGIHKFYLGYYGTGVIMILICFLTCGMSYILAIIEGIIYLSMSNQDFYLTYVQNEKHWF